MLDYPRLLAMIFYAPLRGLREVRDRGPLLPMIVCAFLSQIAYVLISQWLAGNGRFFVRPTAVGMAVFQSAATLLPLAIVLVPLLTFFANLFERRGSFSVVIRQEYAPLASVIFYVFVAANLVTLVIAAFLHFSGIQAAYIGGINQQVPQMLATWRSMGLTEEALARLEAEWRDPVFLARSLFLMPRLLLFLAGTVLGVREVFRVSVLKSLAVTILAGFGTVVLKPLFHTVLASPFMLIMLFLLLRGYFSEIIGNQRARAAFKQNLEAATINPRDASAHYNLGLIHQQRGELDQARERFQRAIDIDPEELDAHYQLGRIARAQNRNADAIAHFEQVVQRDQAHAQHEIWREIGATYLAAEQFSDARDTLERFLDRRTNDPQGLYLIGRAHAGLGHNQEAASSMQACIEAVKTAPAYKYRTEKRWLNEAQQFMKANRQQAVSK